MATVIDDLRWVEKDFEEGEAETTGWVLEAHFVNISVAGPDMTEIVKTSIGWEEVELE